MFERMLSNNLPFSEAIHNKVELPEHDTNLWRSAIEFLKTKEFIPYFKEPVPGEGGNVVRPGSNTLDIHLCIVDQEGKIVVAAPSEAITGTEALSDATYEILKGLVLLFCMADKYGWDALMNICVE